MKKQGAGSEKASQSKLVHTIEIDGVVYSTTSQNEATKLIKKKLAPLEEAIRLANTSKEKVAPPITARYMLHWFMDKKQRDPILGDLEEEYQEEVVLFGKTKADILYWKRVLRSVLPLLVQILMHLIRLCNVLRFIK